MKILAVVKFNHGEAIVLDEMPEMIYTKHDQITIVGKAGPFHVTYGKNHEAGLKAFAGRKFELPLNDGTIEYCSGQWWDAMTAKAKSVLLQNDADEIVSVTANTADSLKKCYVYYGYKSVRSEYEKLRSEYTGPVYEYHEYEKILKKQ